MRFLNKKAIILVTFGIVFLFFTLLQSKNTQKETQNVPIALTKYSSSTPSSSYAKPTSKKNNPKSHPTYLQTNSVPATKKVHQIVNITPIVVKQTTLAAGKITKLKLKLIPNKTNKIDLSKFTKPTAIVFEANKTADFFYTLENPNQLTKIKTDTKTTYNTFISGLIQIPKANKRFLYIKSKISPIYVQLYSNTETISSSGSFLSTTISYNQDKTSGAKYSTLPIIPRVVWGANPKAWDSHSTLSINDVNRLYYDTEHKCRWLPEYYRAQRIIIHHTVTKNYPTDPYRAVREIYLYHAYSRGWKDIGYNFLIDSQGRIFEGKIGGEGVKGYHAFEAANDMSIGIALIGDFTNSLPSNAQLESLKKLMAEKATLFGFDLKYGKASLTKWLDPTYTVFGHRDSFKWVWDSNDWTINNTACPGQKFYNSGLLYQITSQAQEYKQTHFDQIKQARNQALAMLNELENYDYIPALELTLNVDSNAPKEQAEALIPRYSGIKSVRIIGNKAYISVQHNYDNGYCGYIVPPKDWTGYDDCGSHGCMFFPKSEGAIDRLKVLLTIFYLDPNITDIKWYNLGELH